MLIYCGIDEAGYGPLIGPLCVALSAFEVDCDATLEAPNLWKRLKSAVSAAPHKRKIAVADSKALKGPRDGKEHPLRHLERGVLAMLACHGSLPETDDALYELLGVVVAPREHSPWYADPLPLPVAHERDAISVAANLLRVAGGAAGVRLAMLRCEAMDALAFNRAANDALKSDVNFSIATRHIDRLWTTFGDRPLHIVVDRQGGRTRYADVLQAAFPGASVETIDECERVSVYRLERDGSALLVTFEVESESRHLPNALASMTAKYVRELFMERMNRYFCAQLPDLKPTAGYYGDGRRYIDEVRPVLQRLGVSDDRFVRCR